MPQLREPLVRSSALYYPAMVPPDPWIKRNLLLFDSISSVIPEQLPVSNPTLMWLADQGAWRPSFANNLASQAYLEDVEGALQYFASDDSLRFFSGRRPPPRDVNRLYVGKLQPQLEDALQGLALAHPERRAIPYLLVHRKVWEVVLSITAKHLAVANPSTRERLVPGTDLETTARFAYEAQPSAIHRQDCIELILEGLIPTPGDTVSFADVIAFRNSHHDEVLEFRHVLSQMVHQARLSSEPVESIRIAREEIQSALATICRCAERRRLRLTLGRLGLLAVGVVGARALGPAVRNWALAETGRAAMGLVAERAVRGPLPSVSGPFAYLHDAAVSFGEKASGAGSAGDHES